jgi:hypothetical protein
MPCSNDRNSSFGRREATGRKRPLPDGRRANGGALRPAIRSTGEFTVDVGLSQSTAHRSFGFVAVSELRRGRMTGFAAA